MYGISEKQRDMEYGSTYAGDIGDIWSIYLSQIELGDENACLELISVLIGFFSTPPGRDLLSQVFEMLDEITYCTMFNFL